MSGPYPVMSKAAEARGRQIFEMFNHVQTSAFWATLSAGLKKRYGSDAKLATANKKLRERMGDEKHRIWARTLFLTSWPRIRSIRGYPNSATFESRS